MLLEATYSRLNDLFDRLSNKAFSKREVVEILNSVRDILLNADIPYEYVNFIVNELQQKLSSLSSNQVSNKARVLNILMKKYLSDIFSSSEKPISLKDDGVNVIGLFGVNGVGKTTTIAKLANLFTKQRHKTVLCVSLDNQRPAAQQQLKVMCDNNNISFIALNPNDLADSLLKISTIINKRLVDVLIIDVFGVNPDDNEKHNVINSILKNIKFDEKILTIDSSFGQNALNIIRKFNNLVHPTGFIITKTEIDQKGGIFFSVRLSSEKPIYYITNGEKINDIKVFNSNFYCTILKKDNDIRSLLATDNDKDAYIDDKINANGITYYDLLIQLKNLVYGNKFDKMLSFFGKKRQLDTKLSVNVYGIMKKWIAIINSMTMFEKTHPDCLNIDRMNRISCGAGVELSDVMALRKKLQEMNGRS